MAATRDIGTRHPEFMQLVREIQSELLKLAGATGGRYACVPMQGSGTFAVESAIMTSLRKKKGGKILIAENGAYGKRLAQLARHTGTPCHVVSVPEGDVITARHVTPHVTGDVTGVCCVHCETSTGVVNDVEGVGRAVKAINGDVTYLVDAMSSFGAVPLLMSDVIDLMVSSANKCLQGIPGFSYVIADVDKLERCEGVCRSVSLDLHAQHRHLVRSGQFRFTAPTHCMLAFREALRELDDEGGVAARFKRYKLNSELLHRGITGIGFRPFLHPRDHPNSCVITSFHFPRHHNFHFPTFYQRLSDLGDVIYPGQVSAAECFRIGTIGDVNTNDVMRLVDNVRRVAVDEMGVEFD